MIKNTDRRTNREATDAITGTIYFFLLLGDESEEQRFGLPETLEWEKYSEEIRIKPYSDDHLTCIIIDKIWVIVYTMVCIRHFVLYLWLVL